MERIPLIAVVDDDFAMREALAALIETFDYDVQAFSGPEMFLTNFETGAFSCVISDVRMPVVDGLQFQRHLRSIEPTIPVIFVTSYHDETIRKTATRDGASAVLSKPVSAKTLLDELRSAIASNPQ